MRNSLPSLVVTRGDPKNVELYPDDVEPPVNWKDYLIQEPRQKENRWIFTPKDGLDEVKIVYKIGKLSPERHSLRVIDGSNLWRKSPEKGMDSELIPSSLDDVNREIDISKLFKTSQEEFEKREKYVKLRIDLGFVYEDENADISGIGLELLRRFSGLERRIREEAPSGPPPDNLEGAIEEDLREKLKAKELAKEKADREMALAKEKADRRRRKERRWPKRRRTGEGGQGEGAGQREVPKRRRTGMPRKWRIGLTI